MNRVPWLLRDYRWMTSEWMENGNWRKLLLPYHCFFFSINVFRTNERYWECCTRFFHQMGMVLFVDFSPFLFGSRVEELFRFAHVQWKELIDLLFDWFWFKGTLGLIFDVMHLLLYVLNRLIVIPLFILFGYCFSPQCFLYTIIHSFPFHIMQTHVIRNRPSSSRFTDFDC